MDIEIMEAAKSRIDAMDHDFGRLAKRLRKEAGRKRDGRDILADWLEGKRQRPANRPKHVRAEERRRLVADFVRHAEQKGLSWPEILKWAKVKEVKEKLGDISERYLFAARKKYRNIKRNDETARKPDLRPTK
jgi:hypothetical protein